MTDIVADAVNKVNAALRDAEARLKGLAIQESAVTDSLRHSQDQWRQELAAFETEMAARKATFGQELSAHDGLVSKSVEKARKLIEDAQDKVKTLVSDADAAIAKAKSKAQVDLDAIQASLDEKWTAIQNLNNEIRDKAGVLADIKARLQAIAGHSDVG